MTEYTTKSHVFEVNTFKMVQVEIRKVQQSKTVFFLRVLGGPSGVLRTEQNVHGATVTKKVGTK